jgi:hypothetical protein
VVSSVIRSARRERHTEVAEVAAEDGHADHGTSGPTGAPAPLTAVDSRVGLQAGHLLVGPAAIARQDPAADGGLRERLHFAGIADGEQIYADGKVARGVERRAMAEAYRGVWGRARRCR